MIEQFGDLWNYEEEADALCIPTNGFVKKDGKAVTGAGLAAQTKNKFPGIDLFLGEKLKTLGLRVHIIHCNPKIISFPTKPKWVIFNSFDDVVEQAKQYTYRQGQYIPGFYSKSIPSLIESSCKQLLSLCDEKKFGYVVLPKIGCGLGELDWKSEVKPILEKYLDDRFIVCYLE